MQVRGDEDGNQHIGRSMQVVQGFRQPAVQLDHRRNRHRGDVTEQLKRPLHGEPHQGRKDIAFGREVFVDGRLLHPDGCGNVSRRGGAVTPQRDELGSGPRMRSAVGLQRPACLGMPARLAGTWVVANQRHGEVPVEREHAGPFFRAKVTLFGESRARPNLHGLQSEPVLVIDHRHHELRRLSCCCRIGG